MKLLYSHMLVVYVVVFLWVLVLALGLLIMARSDERFESELIPCSVVVPFRNESQNLTALVAALSHQRHKNFEVIFVNDHSTDKSVEVLETAISSSEIDCKVLNLKEGQGKKAALAFGIAKARHDIIITTDADCNMNGHRLQLMSQKFQNHEVKLVTGPVELTGNSFFQQFQNLEMNALMGATELSIKLNRPTMANGANLAFRKNIFEELEGYKDIDHIPSGDDELLMDKVRKKYPDGIRFIKNHKAKVFTEASRSFNDLVNQKRRWASKWKVNLRWPTMVLAIFILMVNISQLALLLDIILIKSSIQVSALALGLKFLAELFFLYQIRFDLKQATRLGPFVLSFFIYPFYAIFIGIAANFGRYTWKERVYEL